MRDLLTHRAGLERADLMWYGTDRTREEILAQVPLVPAACSLRDGFVYQNIMYIAAGERSASVAGQPWEELIAERIFRPWERNAACPMQCMESFSPLPDGVPRRTRCHRDLRPAGFPS